MHFQSEQPLKEQIEVLLVDDNDDDVLLMREAFESARPLDVINVAHDGEEALEYLRRTSPSDRSRRPNLVLLDINMPRKNGFEVLSEMKSDPQLASIPVVMLTTSEREEDVARSYAGGACSFITKPIDITCFNEIAQQFSRYWSQVARLPGSSHFS